MIDLDLRPGRTQQCEKVRTKHSRAIPAKGEWKTTTTLPSAIRGAALEWKSWLFASSDIDAERAARIYTLIETAKLNGGYSQLYPSDDPPASLITLSIARIGAQSRFESNLRPNGRRLIWTDQ